MVASLIDELASRGGLGAALGQRQPAALVPLLDHMRRNVGDPRFSQQLAAVAHRLLDVYGGGLGRDAQVCGCEWVATIVGGSTQGRLCGKRW